MFYEPDNSFLYMSWCHAKTIQCTERI